LKPGVRVQFRKLTIASIDGELHWVATFTGWQASLWMDVFQAPGLVTWMKTRVARRAV
jgi:hypothetical protein